MFAGSFDHSSRYRWLLGVLGVHAPANGQGAGVSIMTMGDFPPCGLRTSSGSGRYAAGSVCSTSVVVCATHRGDAIPYGSSSATPASILKPLNSALADAVAHRVAAIVGMSAVYSERAWPILEAAAIPVIGNQNNELNRRDSVVAFPLGPGLAGQLLAMAPVLALEGAKQISVIVTDYGPSTGRARRDDRPR